MYIFQVSEDGVTCATKAHRKENPIPEGWTQVPILLENKSLYMVDGKLTDKEPQTLIDQRVQEFETEEKIQAEMRRVAIENLKSRGELPQDYRDRRG